MLRAGLSISREAERLGHPVKYRKLPEGGTEEQLQNGSAPRPRHPRAGPHSPRVFLEEPRASHYMVHAERTFTDRQGRPQSLLGGGDLIFDAGCCSLPM